MPRYDYECETCHHQFELRQGFDSEPMTACPECNNIARRKFHAVPIVFKGSGWYVNDYGKKGSTTGAGASEISDTKESSDSKSSSDTVSSPDSKSSTDAGSKPESKPESKTKSPSPSKASSSNP